MHTVAVKSLDALMYSYEGVIMSKLLAGTVEAHSNTIGMIYLISQHKMRVMYECIQKQTYKHKCSKCVNAKTLQCQMCSQ